MRGLLLAFLLCLPSQAAVTLIAHAAGFGNAGSATTSPAIDCSGANFISAVKVDFSTNAQLGTFTDTVGTNTYTPLNNSTDGGTDNEAIWFAYNASVSSSMTFTASGSFPAIFVACWAGVQTSPNPLDTQQINFSAFPVNTGSTTTTTNGDLVIAGISSNAFSDTYSIDLGFTITDQHDIVGASSAGGGSAYLIQGTAGALNPAWSCTVGGCMSGVASIGAFKAAAAGGVYVANPTVIMVGP